MIKTTKASSLFGSIGVVGGVLWSFSKGQPVKQTLITALILGGCGYLLGSAVTKLYE